MNRYIALLRGINVGGQKKILMADLRALLESQGFNNVVSYIQSGNLLFSSSENTDHAHRIQKAIIDKYGWEVPVLITTPDHIKKQLDACPFPSPAKENSYFVLFNDTPSKEQLESIEDISYPGEEFVVGDHCIYLYCEAGYGRAKLSNNFFEKKLRVTATTRNYKTLLKLTQMAGS